MTRKQRAVLGDEARAKRSAAKAAREAAAQNAAHELAARRSKILAEVRTAGGRLEELLREVRKRKRRRHDLADHLAGFYEEIDKLAKGKTLLQVTDLVLTEANQSICDAKTIVEGDVYLDRVKEFVPAGDNPVYPDVVVALRTVRQALDRATPRLEDYEETVEERLQEARTVEVALILTIEEGGPPSLSTVKRRMTGNPETLELSWFTSLYGTTVDASSFDEARLGEIGSLDEYFAVEEGDG